MKTSNWLLSLSLVGLLMTAGCGSNKPSSGEATNANTSPTQQVFTVAVGGEIGDLNPHNYKSSFPALDLVYEPLVRYLQDGSIAPALAKSWKLSDDGKTLTFQLREGVTFHDGTPFDAEAAKWNLQRWVGTKDHDWLPLANKIKSIATPDKYTLTLQLKEPYYGAIQELALVRPVRFLSPKAADATGKYLKPVGTGPWQVQVDNPTQRAVFTPYQNYWGTKPQLNEVVFDVIPDAQTRVAALMSGQATLIGGDSIGGIPLESVTTLKNDPKVQLLTAPGSTTYFIQTNYDRPPLGDVRVRQAFSYAINREAIASKVFNNLATPAKGIFAPKIPYAHYSNPQLYAYNPEQAKTLLAEAGWKPGKNGILEKNGKPLQLTLIVDGDSSPQAKSMGEVIQAQLREIGVAVDVRLVDSGAWNDALMKKQFDLAINLTWGSPYDPHLSLKQMFHSSSKYAEHGGVYGNPKLDKLIDNVLASKDEKERQNLYVEIQKVMDENVAAIPIVYSNRVYAVSNKVTGFKLAGTEYELDLQEVTTKSQ
ncbi:nickel ABC transporter substrate-binding protein [Aerosakkonema funiforme]|uniref:nickel ABC transporter substrate-binding protein n=1 Tax=Aerosakkonema funiforme TaxID=1246630 RepID=UPI0035B7171E